MAATFALGGSAALLAACGGSDDENGAASGSASGGGSKFAVAKPEDSAAKAKPGGVLKGYAQAEPRSLDPVNPQADYNRIAPFVYSTLMVAKPGHLEPPTGELQGQLAKSLEVSPDGLTMTFHLRPGVKWHNRPPVNGREFDIDDVKFSLDHYKELGPLASLVFNSNSPGAPVLSTEFPDASTVVMKLKDPIVYLPNWFACFGSFTGQIAMYPKEAGGGGLDLSKDIIGTGPFQLKAHSPSVSFTLQRNPDYWDDKAALIDEVEMPIVPGYQSRESQLQAGNIYYSVSTSNTLKNEDVLSVMESQPPLLLYQSPYNTNTTSNGVITFGHLPVGKSKFQDERVRQAISMSWDRDLYINAMYNVDKFEKAGLPQKTAWNSHLQFEDAFGAGGWFLDPQSSEFGENAKYFQYNLEEAKKLLSAAGYDDGFEVEVRYPNASQFSLVRQAQIIIGFLQGLGLQVKDNGLTDYTQDYIPHDRDASGEYEGIGIHSVTGSTAIHVSPISSLVAQHLPSSGVTFQGYDINGKGDMSGDPQLIDMLTKAETVQDVNAQKKLIKDAQRYLGKAMYSMFFPGTATEFWVAWPAVKNFNVWQGGSDETWERYQMWLDPTQPPLA